MCVSLLPAFSVSANAFAVNDYTVYTSWWEYNTPTEYTGFKDIIQSETKHNKITVQSDIILPTAIRAETMFDIKFDVMLSEAENISLRQIYLKDGNGTTIDSIYDASFVDGRIEAKSIQVPKDVKSIRVFFDITNPTWTDEYGNTYLSGYKVNTYYNGSLKNISQNIESLSVTADGYVMYTPSAGDTETYKPMSKYVIGLASTQEKANSKNADILEIGKSIELKNDITIHIIVSDELPEVEPSEPEPITYLYECQWNNIEITEVDEGGLINNIIGWIKKIYNGITSIPTKITETANSIIESITQLPQKIADIVKNLFIPSEDDITAIKTDFEDLLSDRFGAVYESSDILVDFATAFTDQGTQETITFPSTTVNLAGTDFTFGGWEVDVVPDFLSGLIDVLKLIVNISCTFLFVNGMRKRLEGILE